tara:strand:+ start:399 stop:1358 length:960 start_codon:yes stop_codon:yes gene_type:complete
MKNTCRVCNNTEGNNHYRAKEMMYGLREEFDYFECANCGCLQIVDFPADMSKYYPGDYYSFYQYDGKKFEGLKGAIKKKQYALSALGGLSFWSTIGKLIGKKEYRIFSQLNVNRETRILDVGCGNGRNFQYPLAEIGFKNLLGCDPYLPDDIHYPNGLEIKKSEVFEVEGKWDMITYHHSFEHLPNPKEHFKKVHELLDDDGVCIIRIPTVSSYAWEHYKEKWVQLDAPRHFFLHSNKSMTLLAEELGFDLYKIDDDANHFQFTGSEKYLNDIPLSAPKDKGILSSIKRKWKNYKYNKKAKRLNRLGKGDQSAFYFRKK